MSCDPIIPPTEPTNPPILVDAAEATLILDTSIPAVRTIREETDAVGAMRRGLKEYLGQVSKDVAGKTVRFEETFEEWATSEDDNVRYPAAAVLLADGTVSYDAHNLAPVIYPGDLLPDGRVVIKVSEAVAPFSVEMHCSNPGERLAVSMLLEEALHPVDFMYGFALHLPFYFGMQATFFLVSTELPDDAASARHGLRVIRARIEGRIPVVRPRLLPGAQPLLTTEIVGPGGTFSIPTGLAAVSRGRL